MIHLSTTQKFDPLLLINLENIKVGQISFLNVATFKSAQVPWTYIFIIHVSQDNEEIKRIQQIEIKEEDKGFFLCC